MAFGLSCSISLIQYFGAIMFINGLNGRKGQASVKGTWCLRPQGLRLSQLLPLLLSAWLLAGMATIASAQNDVLVKIDGTRLSGKVTQMSADAVTIEVRKTPNRVPTQDIDHIRFDDEPARMNSVREAVSGRQYEQAIKDMSGMDFGSAGANAKLEGLFFRASAETELALAGSPGRSISEAVGLVRKFQEEGKNHYRFFPSVMLFARLGKASNRLGIAKEAFQNLSAVSDKSIALKANLELGQLALIEKDYAAAEKFFGQALANDATDPQSTDLKNVAKILANVAVAGQGKIDVAIDSLKQSLGSENPDNPIVFGYIYNALGSVYLIAEKQKEAEAAFLHTDLLFMGNAEAHPEALYQLVQIWTAMGKTGRVSEAKEKLKTRYGGTYWFQKLSG